MTRQQRSIARLANIAEYAVITGLGLDRAKYIASLYGGYWTIYRRVTRS
jgi:hypothetical protein